MANEPLIEIGLPVVAVDVEVMNTDEHELEWVKQILTDMESSAYVETPYQNTRRMRVVSHSGVRPRTFQKDIKRILSLRENGVSCEIKVW